MSKLTKSNFIAIYVNVTLQVGWNVLLAPSYLFCNIHIFPWQQEFWVLKKRKRKKSSRFKVVYWHRKKGGLGPISEQHILSTFYHHFSHKNALVVNEKTQETSIKKIELLRVFLMSSKSSPEFYYLLCLKFYKPNPIIFSNIFEYYLVFLHDFTNFVPQPKVLRKCKFFVKWVRNWNMH